MKKAMWSVDETGSFSFSDKHSGQLKLLAGFDQEWLASVLSKDLANRTMSVAEIRHHILTETPCYLYAEALKALEKSQRLDIVSGPPDRRKYTFAKYLDDPRFKVRFVALIS